MCRYVGAYVRIAVMYFTILLLRHLEIKCFHIKRLKKSKYIETFINLSLNAMSMLRAIVVLC